MCSIRNFLRVWVLEFVELLQRIDKTKYKLPQYAETSAIIIELSPFFRKDIVAADFDEFGFKLYDNLMHCSHPYGRVDVVPDRYFPGSLKTLTRAGRGRGPIILFDGKTELPNKFKDSFLKNSDNKERLNLFLADRIFNLHSGDKKLTIAKGDTVVTTDPSIASDQTIAPNFAEEADQKIVRHMIQCVRNGFRHVVIRTVDSDVIISLLAYRHYAENFECEVYAWLAAGSESVYYDITKIALDLGEQTCKALPFFHAFTGCDITSSFFNQGKCKFWDRWMEFDDVEILTNVFSVLSAKPLTLATEQIDIIEKFVCFVYYDDVSDPIDQKRIKDFEHSTHNNLRLIPPSRLGLIEHVKRAVYYAGWINFQCVENVHLPDPGDWGWGLVDGEYLPTWHKPENSSSTAELVTMVCSCGTKKCTDCRCAKVANFECLPFCKCQRRCLYKPI